MQTVLLVIHLMIAAALVGVVLVQRSEGGALGIGGGGGFMSGRGQANFMTRMTAYLACAFFVTSIGVSLLANTNFRSRSLFDTPAATQPAGVPKADAPATPTPAAPPAPPRGGILDKLQTPGGAQAPLPKQ